MREDVGCIDASKKTECNVLMKENIFHFFFTTRDIEFRYFTQGSNYKILFVSFL